MSIERIAEIGKQHEPSAAAVGHSRNTAPSSASLPPALQLQQMAGNLAVQRLLRSGVIQAKLSVSQPSDPYEQEADRVAQQVTNMSTAPAAISGQTFVQRQASDQAEVLPLAPTITPLVQRAPSESPRSIQPRADFEARLGSRDGVPLPASSRAFMERQFGSDFSGVRLHTGGEAAQLNRAISAQAFTHGRDIYLGEGTNNLESTTGKQLLAHELTHTIQQGGTAGSTAARSLVVQRQPAPVPPAAAPTPAPASGVTKPGSPAPVVGASKAETDPVELPLVARRFPITFTSTRRDMRLTTEDLSEFEILKGELSTPPIPIPDTGVTAKFSAKADQGIRLTNFSLFMTPITGEIEASQIAAAQSNSGPSTLGVIGAAAGGIIGGVAGAVLGLEGIVKGAEIGGKAGGKAGDSLADVFAGDKEIKVRLTQGGGGLSATLTYSPELTMALSASGFSWLATLETTLLTNLRLTLEALLDFKESYVSLMFRSGRLLPSEFHIKPIIRPVLAATLDASGQLMARLVILPFLRGEQPKVGEEEAIEAAEVVSVPFHLFTWSGSFEGDPLFTASKSSPMEVRGKHVKADPGKVPAAFSKALAGSKLKADTTKKTKPKAAGSTGGPPTGLTPNDPIPLVWWKPFDAYVEELHLPASEFGTDRKARRYPNKHYRNERRGTDLSLGVGNWPYPGMLLKKKQNDRDEAKVLRFKEDLALHGVDLDRQAPGTQVDHVIDLVFHVGFDREDNFWPLDAGVNTRAGSKWTFGTYLVTWADQPGDPPVNTTPAHVPVGRWFVLVDPFQRA
jgi:hypothetical protein